MGGRGFCRGTSSGSKQKLRDRGGLMDAGKPERKKPRGQKLSIGRAKALAIIRELKLRRCDNFRPVGVGVWNAAKKLLGKP